MKAKFAYTIILTIVVNVFFISCDEDKWLSETPKDFYAPENSYVTNEHFQMAVNNLYYDLRYWAHRAKLDMTFSLYYATDLAVNATNYLPGQFGKLNDYTNNMIPNNTENVLPMWTYLYKLIYDANTIVDRLDHPNCQVDENGKKAFKSEALFFRAFAYRTLAHLFGGVPLVVNEVTSPRRDLVRATREEVYRQCVADLEYAAVNLNDIDQVKDGQVSKQVCQHLLSELYISLQEWDKAIQAATAVIDHPATGLMTSRFGARKTEPGDVYWDLFRDKNKNRSSGNTEELYVIQYDFQNAGSNHNSGLSYGFRPLIENLSLGGKTLFAGNTSEKGGRSIAWGKPTSHFLYTIWKDNFNNDIRNSTYNITRDVQLDNPASPHFGKWMVADGINKMGIDTVRGWFPYINKLARVGDIPSDYYQKNPDGSPKKTAFGETLVTNSANSSFSDEYLFRLAETYLLRAEAYIGKGNPSDAANDINIIRARANATPISASQATLDYVLDERLRELHFEEFRMVTLTRLGKLVERNRLYNQFTGTTISDHHNLWPIPYSEIERNVFGNIEQNPGYAN